MNGKHTPGPWHSKKHGSRHRIVDRQDITLAHVPIGYMDYAAGNARLIAAAPEMFEALNVAWELIINLGRPETNDRHHAACEKIRTALSKATGEQ